MTQVATTTARTFAHVLSSLHTYLHVTFDHPISHVLDFWRTCSPWVQLHLTILPYIFNGLVKRGRFWALQCRAITAAAIYCTVSFLLDSLTMFPPSLHLDVRFWSNGLMPQHQSLWLRYGITRRRNTRSRLPYGLCLRIRYRQSRFHSKPKIALCSSLDKDPNTTKTNQSRLTDIPDNQPLFFGPQPDTKRFKYLEDILRYLKLILDLPRTFLDIPRTFTSTIRKFTSRKSCNQEELTAFRSATLLLNVLGSERDKLGKMHHALINAPSSHHMPIVIDTGCSLSLTPFKSDFVTKISKTEIKDMKGIKNTIPVKGIGIVEWPIRDVFNNIGISNQNPFILCSGR